MKIRDKLLISYIFIVLIIIFLSFFYSYTVIGNIYDMGDKALEEAAENIVNKNLKLSANVLTSYAERIVELRADDTADDLSIIFGGMKKFDINKIRNNETIRKIVLQNILTYDGKVAGYIDMYDDKGNSIIHPNKSVEGTNYSEWKDEYPKMWELVQKSFKEPIVKGYYEFMDEDNQKKKKYMVLIRVDHTPFIISASVNIDQFFLPVHSNIRETIVNAFIELKKTALALEEATLLHIRKAAIFGGLFLLIIGIITALLLSNSISSPINKLTDGVRQLGKGNFSTTVPEDGSLEIVQLSHSFNELGKELTSYIDQLRKEVSVRQALESEIKIARRIQETMLPHKFPENKNFNIHAVLEPAKEVSGDFFDIFFVKEGTLALLVGDVSGKGIPASIFMALTATALKSNCRRITDSPAEVLKETNQFLQDYEEACMFITVFLAYYDINTGILKYANAGHNPAISLKPGGECKFFGSCGDVALGALPEFNYKEDEYKLDIDESLVLYTDGVTEATSSENEEYGNERLCELLHNNSSSSPEEISKTVLESLSKFQGENQFDDITFMMLRRKE